MKLHPRQAIEWRLEDLVDLHAESPHPSPAIVEVVRGERLVATLFPSDNEESEKAAIRFAPMFSADVVLVMLDIPLDEPQLPGDRALVFTAIGSDGEKAGTIVPYSEEGYYQPLEDAHVSGTHEEWIMAGFKQHQEIRPAIDLLREEILEGNAYEARVREDCVVAKLLLEADVVVALLSERGSEEIIAESFADEEVTPRFEYQQAGPDISMN